MKEKSLLIALTLLLQQASAQPGLGGSSPTSPVTGLVTRANLQTGNPLPGVNYYGKGYTNHYDYLLNYYYPGQSTAYKLKADQAAPPANPSAGSPPQPLKVLVDNPRLTRATSVTGSCTIPASTGYPPAGTLVWGAHVWLANMLYNEATAWPFDLYVTQYTRDANNDYVFSFAIPLFSHTEVPHNVYDTRDIDATKATLEPREQHGWASHGAGQWFVLCNSFHLDGIVDGQMRFSAYAAQDDMHLDASLPPNPADTQVILDTDGYPTSRWNLGVAKKWVNNNTALNPSIPNGLWGKYVTIPSNLNHDNRCCFRHYKTLAGSGPVLTTTLVTSPIKTTLTAAGNYVDDCCWFNLGQIMYVTPVLGIRLDSVPGTGVVNLAFDYMTTTTSIGLTSAPGNKYSTTGAWVKYEVLRPDVTGAGRSTVVTENAAYSVFFPCVATPSLPACTFKHTFSAPVGLRQTYMVRYAVMNHSLGIDVWSTWSYVHYAAPKIANTKPFLNTTAVDKRGWAGFSAAQPVPVFQNKPFTFKISSYPYLFGDNETSFDAMRFSFAYDISQFSYSTPDYRKTVPPPAVATPWIPEQRLGIRGNLPEYAWYSTPAIKAASVEGSWLQAQVTIVPTEVNKLYALQIEVEDDLLPRSMWANPSAAAYDYNLQEGKTSSTTTFWLYAVACETCPAGQTPLWLCHDNTNQTACKACATCPAGSYISKQCSQMAIQDTICKPCSTACPLGMKIVPGSDTCDGGGTSNIACELCSRCPEGSYASGGCDGSGLDTVCSPCPPVTASNLFIPVGCPVDLRNVSLGGAGGGVVYRACVSCGDEEYQTTPCTATTDRTCGQCTTCASNEYETSPCSFFRNRQCASCSATCPTGSFIAKPCSAHADAVCAACTASCPERTYKVADCSANSDTLCSPCDCDWQGTAACTSSGTCVCKAGFSGARCDTCAARSYGFQCSQTCACSSSGAASQECSTADGHCTCKPNFAGLLCDQCVAGRYGPNCDGVCSCNGHGRCIDGVYGTGQCVCDPGWGGATCTQPLGAGVYAGTAPVSISAQEGTPLTWPLPTNLFVILQSIDGVMVAANVSAGALEISLASGPTWLSLSPSTSAASGFALTGTPQRSDVDLTGTRVEFLGTTQDSSARIRTAVIVTYVNHAPRFPWASTATPLPALAGDTFTFSVVQGRDVQDDELALGDKIDITFRDLPSWLVPAQPDVLYPFTAPALRWNVSGTPPAAANGTAPWFTVVATDAFGATASMVVRIQVANGVAALTFNAAAVAAEVPSAVEQGSYVSFVVPESMFQVGSGAQTRIVRYAASIQPGSSTSRRRLVEQLQERRLMQLLQSPLLNAPGASAPRLLSTTAPACSWLNVAASTDAVPRPLIYGTPGPDDGRVPCIITVTAMNAAGFSVSGVLVLRVRNVNDPPRALVQSTAFSRPAAELFTLSIPVSLYFTDADVPEGDRLTYRVADLSGDRPVPAFLSFTCTYGTAVSQDSADIVLTDTCSLRGNASLNDIGTLALSLVASDTSNATASVPLVLRITKPSVYRTITTDWSPCSVQCGGGSRYRSTTCVDVMGVSVDLSNCDAGTSGAVSMVREACGAQPCAAPYYHVGSWGACSDPCSRYDAQLQTYLVPTTERNVTCISSSDPLANAQGAVPDSVCIEAGITRPALVRSCNTQACVVPANSTAVAPVATSCTAVLDPAGNCCDSTSPSGFCCMGAYQVPDDCGVCGGVNDCPVLDKVTLSSTTLSSRLCNADATVVADTTVVAGVRADMARALAATLEVEEAAVIITAMACVRRTYDQLDVDISYTLNNTRVETALVVDAIQERLPSFAALQGYQMQSRPLSAPVRVGSCGNGVCETGEVCTDADCSNRGACSDDCGLIPKQCPSPLDATGLRAAPCAGNGACKLDTGACVCTTGWTGAACDACAHGYTLVLQGAARTKMCVALSDLGSNAAAGTTTEAPFDRSPGFTAIVAIGCSIFAAGAAVRFVNQRAAARAALRKGTKHAGGAGIDGAAPSSTGSGEASSSRRSSLPAQRVEAVADRPRRLSNVMLLAARRLSGGAVDLRPMADVAAVTTTSALSGALSAASAASNAENGAAHKLVRKSSKRTAANGARKPKSPNAARSPTAIDAPAAFEPQFPGSETAAAAASAATATASAILAGASAMVARASRGMSRAERGSRGYSRVEDEGGEGAAEAAAAAVAAGYTAAPAHQLEHSPDAAANRVPHPPRAVFAATAVHARQAVPVDSGAAVPEHFAHMANPMHKNHQ